MVTGNNDLSNDLMTILRERGIASTSEPDGSIGVQTSEDGISYGLSHVESAGYSILWNTYDREPSKINNNAVPSKLRERFPSDHPMAGQFAWTPTQPELPPFRGTAICPLHKNAPNRGDYDRKGYPICSREALPNEAEAREHFRLKHPRTYRMEQEELERNQRDRDREFQRMIAERVAGGTPVIPGSTSNIAPPPAPTPNTAPTEPPSPHDGEGNFVQRMRRRVRRERTPEQIAADRERMARVRAARNKK